MNLVKNFYQLFPAPGIGGLLGQPETLINDQVPQVPSDLSNGGEPGRYELGMNFKSKTSGVIKKIRFLKPADEDGNHFGKIWNLNKQLLFTVEFTNKTESGWQEQELSPPLPILTDTVYTVSVNSNSYYVYTQFGLNPPLESENLTTDTGLPNGVFNEASGFYPETGWGHANYFVDIEFLPDLNGDEKVFHLADASTYPGNQNQSIAYSELSRLQIDHLIDKPPVLDANWSGYTMDFLIKIQDDRPWNVLGRYDLQVSENLISTNLGQLFFGQNNLKLNKLSKIGFRFVNVGYGVPTESDNIAIWGELVGTISN